MPRGDAARIRAYAVQEPQSLTDCLSRSGFPGVGEGLATPPRQM